MGSLGELPGPLSDSRPARTVQTRAGGVSARPHTPSCGIDTLPLNAALICCGALLADAQGERSGGGGQGIAGTGRGEQVQVRARALEQLA
jgi:hypothetical protein